jgi:hypothetical protein
MAKFDAFCGKIRAYPNARAQQIAFSGGKKMPLSREEIKKEGLTNKGAVFFIYIH